MKDGLSDNYILSVAQDRNGFIWIGTENGLNRFDGSAFTYYKAENTGLTDNGINSLLPDPTEDIIWIATKKGGLIKLDTGKALFSSIDIPVNEGSSLPVYGVTDLCFSKNGDIWIATYNKGLKKLKRETEEITHYDLSSVPLPSDYRIKSIKEDNYGNLYIGHWGNGLTILLNDGNMKHFCYEEKKHNGLPGNEILDICFDSFNNVWLATHHGLALYNPDNDSFTVYKKDSFTGLSDDDIHSLCEINGYLWMATWSGGINILDIMALRNTGVPDFRTIECNDLPTGLSPSSVKVFCDSFNNIWMGSYGSGVNIISHTQPFFNILTYSSLKGDDNSLSNRMVNCLTFDNDSLLWVGMNKGHIDVYKKDSSSDELIKVSAYGLEEDILASLTDHKGNVWFGVNRKGLYVYEKQNGKFKNIRYNPEQFRHSYITSLYEDRNHNIWICTHDGIIRYDCSASSFTEFDVRQKGLKNDLVTSFIQDDDGNYWIGSTTDGLIVVTQEFDFICHFTSSDALSSNLITNIYKDSSSRIWVCTSKGITLFDSTDSYKIFDDNSGPGNNFVSSVAEGKHNEFWIATNSGIIHYDEKRSVSTSYDHHNGINYLSFKNSSVARSADGMIYFGSQNGICYFNSGKEIISHDIPEVKITGFAFHDKGGDMSVNKVYLPVTGEIELPYNHNTVTIEFNVMDYALKDKVEYMFRLNDDRNMWNETDGNNQVSFHNLSPGTYKFNLKVKAYNREWSEITSVKFIINPPLWLSLWAKLIYISISIVIAVAVLLFYKRKIDAEKMLYIEKQNSMQQHNLNEERLRFYTNITHELRTPLTLIIGPLADMLESSEKHSEQNRKLSVIHKSAVRLSDLINQILEFRKSETQNRTLNVMFGDPAILLQETVLKYQELNRKKNVSVEFICEPVSPIFYDKEILTIVTDNLISNALKYTDSGIVSVILKELNEDGIIYTEIEVCDTGCGISTEEQDKIFGRYYQVNDDNRRYGTGIGLALVKNLVTLHEGCITVESIQGKGSKFRMRLQRDNRYGNPVIAESGRETSCTCKALTPADSSLPTLLIVEDNEEIRNYIAESFADTFNIIEAADGKAGTELALEVIPDMIISDIMMPVTDGNVLCKTLKEDLRTSHIPLILLTAKGSEKDKEEGYSSGADSYITKPFTASVLKSRVSNLMEGRKKIAEYFSTNHYKKAAINLSLNKMDNEFIEKVESAVSNNMGNVKTDITFLSEQLNMSYSAFTKKIKAVTGLTANEFVRKTKMRHVEQMMLSGKYNISEIAELTGYNSMAYFREAFKEEFGVLPSKFIAGIKEQENI